MLWSSLISDYLFGTYITHLQQGSTHAQLSSNVLQSTHQSSRCEAELSRCSATPSARLPSAHHRHHTSMAALPSHVQHRLHAASSFSEHFGGVSTRSIPFMLTNWISTGQYEASQRQRERRDPQGRNSDKPHRRERSHGKWVKQRKVSIPRPAGKLCGQKRSQN